MRRREALEDDEAEAVGAVLQRWAGLWHQLAAQWPKTTQLRVGGVSVPVDSYSDNRNQARVPGS
jgi:hypothetical protein